MQTSERVKRKNNLTFIFNKVQSVIHLITPRTYSGFNTPTYKLGARPTEASGKQKKKQRRQITTNGQQQHGKQRR